MKRLANEYFEQVYAQSEDPWGFASRWYEQRKYALTLAALPRERYRRAFEPGCSFGVLSELLAVRCDALIASEVVPSVSERARRRLQHFTHVRVETAAIPEFWPEGSFDLIVLSEVAYYLSEAGFAELLTRLEQSTSPDAHVIAVHYRGATDYPLSGDRVHDLLHACPLLQPLVRHAEEAFLLEVFARGQA
jgi:trans-aconitate methyltransferase